MSFLNIAMLTLTEIIGDFGFKEFARKGTAKGFTQGSLGYLGVIYFLIKSLRQGNVIYVDALWNGGTSLLETLAAYFILGERLNGPIQYVGLVLIIVGIFMLHAPDDKLPY